MNDRRFWRRLFSLSCTTLFAAGLATTAAHAATAPLDARSASELSAALGARVEVSHHAATGSVRFLRVAPGSEADLQPGAGSADERARAFFSTQRSLFGIRDAKTELVLRSDRTDRQGFRHLTYDQFYRGVPVFAGLLRAHFDKNGRLHVVNGAFVPGIDVDVQPRISALTATERAIAATLSRNSVSALDLSTSTPRLVVYRLGFDQGIAGRSHLAWEVEVWNGGDVREHVYVDAIFGKPIDALPGVNEAMTRRAYPGTDGTPPANSPQAWPASPTWVEGNPFPTANVQQNNMLLSSKDVYDRFFAGFGRDSYDAAGHTMDQAYERDYNCPNASWNGNLISFCPGFTTHDVTAHEWGHAYTQFTHGLIYRWQSGALNEAYSDIWGEALDLKTDLSAGMVDLDTPVPTRSSAGGVCSAYMQVPPQIVVNSPAPIAATYTPGTANFGPWVFTPLTQAVQVMVDAVADVNDGCTAATNAGALAGKIAFANRGGCSFYEKTINAQNAGAVAIIIGNVPTSATPGTAPLMGCGTPAPAACTDFAYTISSLSLNLADADIFRANLAVPINATIQPTPGGTTENSLRWMMGEDVSPGGALRDMWDPTCMGSPGKVSDVEYWCDPEEADNGGVHFNSGVPNHAFALLVDGGTYNGETITAIGMVEALHIYYRAQTEYQNPTSNFADHADALLQSCDDLVGDSLPDPWGGAAQTLSAADCLEVQDAMDAVEMTDEPNCEFATILQPNPPALCAGGFAYTTNFFDWESSLSGWTTGSRAVVNAGTFDPTPWQLDNSLPADRVGQAVHGPDPNLGDCAVDDESGIVYLESPAYVIPSGGQVPSLAIDHLISTEPDFDGGNVKVSVNNGPYTVLPQARFTFNAQNGNLAAAPTNTNPMASEPAWNGGDQGTNEGSWGRTLGNLNTVVAPGQTFKLRLEMGRDGCGGTSLGWFVDDLRIYTCTAADPLFLDGFEVSNAARWSAAVP